MKERDWVKEKIVSIDFDGVLAKYDGFKEDGSLGSPMSGAKKFVISLIDSGFTPVVFTVRSAKIINSWLKENNFPSIEVTNTKYPSLAYIDDRCIQFNGDFNKLFNDMKKFDVYWRKKEKSVFDDLKFKNK